MSFWNPGFSIDFDAIVRFKLRHTSIAQLERRFNTPAHIRCDPSLKIPVFVRAYLSRGGKLADRQPSSVKKGLAEVKRLEHSLHIAAMQRTSAPRALRGAQSSASTNCR